MRETGDRPPEVEGTLGQLNSGMYLVKTPGDVASLTAPDKLAYVTQPTLSGEDATRVVDAQHKCFPI
jgi:4-hydroxy-3-methylbut-2-enyl diphosphate reductase